MFPSARNSPLQHNGCLPSEALPIIETLLLRDQDGADPYVPLLLWWAVERHAISALASVEAFFSSPPAWKSSLVREVIIERLMRRWTAEGSPAAYDACGRLLASAPDAQERGRLLTAIEQGFHDRPAGPVRFGTGGLFANTEVAEVRTNAAQAHIEHLTPVLSAQLDSLWRDDSTDPALISIRARAGLAGAVARARALLDDAAAPQLCISMIRLLGELRDPSDAEHLLKLASNAPEAVQLAALDALPAFDAPEIPAELLKNYAKLNTRVRTAVRQVLLSRKTWAAAILREV